MDERKYYDINGKKVTLYQMVRREPEWAESRIRVCEKLEAETERLSEALDSAGIQLANREVEIRGLVSGTEIQMGHTKSIGDILKEKCLEIDRLKVEHEKWEVLEAKAYQEKIANQKAEISAQYELAGEKQAEIDRLQRKLTESNRECMRQSGKNFEVLNMIEIALGADLTLEEYETVFNKVLDKHRPPKPTINRIDCKGVGDNDGYFEITKA